MYPAVQAPIVYLLKNPVETHAISQYSYDQTSFPYDAPGATMSYAVTLTSGANLITTVSGTDILIGDVTSLNAGSTTGPITNTAKAGTSVYTLTGTLSGTINGITIPANAQTTETVTIHVVDFTISITDMLFKVRVAAVSSTYTVSHSPVHADVPTYTYQGYDMLEDAGSGYLTPVYSAVTHDPDPSVLSVTVYETDNINSGRYLMKIVCDLVQQPGYAIEQTFNVDVYDFIVLATPADIHHLIGSVQMDTVLTAFTITHTAGLTTAE